MNGIASVYGNLQNMVNLNTNAAFLHSRRHNLAFKLKLITIKLYGTSACGCNNNAVIHRVCNLWLSSLFTTTHLVLITDVLVTAHCCMKLAQNIEHNIRVFAVGALSVTKQHDTGVGWAIRWTSLLRYIQADHTNIVSEYLASQVGSWQHWADLYQHQQIPNQTDPIKYPHRAHQTAIIRPRTQHAPLNAHLHRIMKDHPAKCVYCPNSDETVGHILISQFLLQNVVLRQNIFIETSTLPNWACHKYKIISRIICSCVIYQPWVKRHGWALSHRM